MRKRAELKIDNLEQPLETGVTLIEASAGTGKTYTIAAIFLRLIVEQGLAVDHILVTTFTRPATAELRDRIRSVLHEAHEAFRTGESKNPLLTALLTKFAECRTEKQMLLRDALRGFDEAAIDTIHAFCQRVLTRFAFESGAAADPEFITDESLLLQEVACDFWRRRYYECADCVSAAARHGGLSPGGLAALLGEWLTQPAADWRPKPAPGEIGKLECTVSDALDRLRALWPKAEKEVRRILFELPKWANKPYNEVEAMEEALQGAASCLAPASPLYSLQSLLLFARSQVEAKTKAKAVTPRHDFFDACEDLLVLLGRYQVAVEGEFLTWAPEQLRRRKERANLVSFVDLLTRLDAELKSARGEALRESLRKQYPAALIDEFQDTDPLQDAIFERVFGAPGWLFLIGDPKQAIFGFRGADVFTYLAASKRAARPLTLGTNYRSTTPLVRATNAIFSNGTRPFVDERIRFESATSAGRADDATFAGDGLAAPLRLWFSDDGSEPSTAEFSDMLTAATAGEIARLLAPGGGRIGTREVIPSDIAVLTDSNAEAAKMQEALRALGVPSALLSTSSVFESREAREMSTLLHAVSRPQDERRVRAALLTDLLGQTVLELHALSHDAAGWEKWSALFHAWHEAWRHSGFVAMFRRVLRETKARPRLLARPDGERRLTNLLHLAELVQCAATEEQLAPPALVKWLATRIATPPPRNDVYELRLERDDEAVRLVTVHKSKGLEYNIVFCPFAWKACRKSDSARLRFHDDDDKPVLDLGSDDLPRHRPRAFQEALAEDVRLLYVALTRARHRCDVALARMSGQFVSATSWLLQDAPPAPLLAAPPDDDLHGALKGHFEGIDAARWRSNIDAVAEDAKGAIAIVEIPPAKAPLFVPPQQKKKRRAARRFKGEIERDFTISSFSSLTDETSADAPERFAPPWTEAGERAAATDDIHAFSAGARTGVCLHEIFERLDFTDLSNAEGIVGNRLKAAGFDAKRWTGAVAECVHHVLESELPPGFRLDRIAPGERLVEREFHFPVSRLEPEKLAELSGLDPENRLHFSPRTGWLKGFIDLVFRYDGRFYLVDWKSNRLGPNGAAYSAENIAASMASHHYPLQAQLYALALHRYLRQRVAGYRYDEHFGGMSYLFVRGVDPAAPGQGVWHHRPSADAIAALDDWLT